MKGSFKQPDRNGPRFREKRLTILNRNLYDRFIKKYPEHKDISLEQFKEIVKAFNSNLCQGVIDNRDGVELPEGLGFIFMGTCPPARKVNVDVARSIEHGQTVKHQNWDSDNNLLKLFYTNRTSKYPFQNKQVWSFKAVRQFRKRASDAYKENWPKYIVVDDTKKVSDMFARMRKRDYIIAEGQKLPEDYDEFKM